MVISGYLISTAKGQGIDVFGWFELPALLPDNEGRGDLAGDIHEVIGTLFMLMVLLHAGAALVHHFMFKDRTLKRMLSTRSK
jgi:cytochrome b561